MSSGGLKSRQLKVMKAIHKRRRTINIAKSNDVHSEPQSDHEDSFTRRFDARSRQYSHKLIGDIKLYSFKFNIATEDSHGHAESRASTLQIEPKLPKVTLPSLSKFFDEVKEKEKSAWTKERKRRMLTSINHYRALHTSKTTKSQLNKLLPSTSLGQHDSREFFNSVKEGDLRSVTNLLRDCRWLAQSRDGADQTALHWAARRNYHQIADILLESGAFVNSRDIVRLRQAGRTPLYIAAKFNSLAIVRILLKNSADPYLKTSAGKQANSSNVLITKLLSQSKAQYIVKLLTKSVIKEGNYLV